MTPFRKSGIFNQLKQLFTHYGHQNYIGEECSQISHMLQSAQLGEAKYPHDSQFISACLLHDVGQLHGLKLGLPRDQWGVQHHEYVSGKYLRDLGFQPKVYKLVENHVYAKRYLISTNFLYHKHLSESSLQTLKTQGGLLSYRQVQAFKATPYFQQSIDLRHIDDQAKKVITFKADDLDRYEWIIWNSL